MAHPVVAFLAWASRRDLQILGVGSVVAAIAIWLIPSESVLHPLRVALGIPFLFAIPGYAALQGIFANTAMAGPRDRVETVTLSIAVSLAIVTVIGAVLGTVAFSRTSLVTTLLLFSLCCLGVAWHRRGDEPIAGQDAEDPEGDPVLPRLLVVALLLVSVVSGVWIASIATDMGGPPPPVEYAVLPADGDADGFADAPPRVGVGESVSLRLAITNGASTPRTFAVTVEYSVHRNGSVLQTRDVETFEVEVPGETRITVPRTESLNTTGRTQVAYRIVPLGTDAELGTSRLHLWTTVVSSRNTTASSPTQLPGAAIPPGDIGWRQTNA